MVLAGEFDPEFVVASVVMSVLAGFRAVGGAQILSGTLHPVSMRRRSSVKVYLEIENQIQPARDDRGCGTT